MYCNIENAYQTVSDTINDVFDSNTQSQYIEEMNKNMSAEHNNDNEKIPIMPIMPIVSKTKPDISGYGYVIDCVVSILFGILIIIILNMTVKLGKWL